MTGGTVVSHPDFSPSIDAVLDSRGNDYIRNDPDGKRMRLDAHTVLKLSLPKSFIFISPSLPPCPRGTLLMMTVKGQEPGELRLYPLHGCR